MVNQEKIIKESMLRTGALLHGTYRIDDYLSSGGFGNTYVVTHVNFNEKYALKEFFMKGVSERDGNNTTVSVSNNEKVAEFNEQLEKFKKEARRLRKLNNSHIVRVHDLFEENGTAYYVMDYINGENLKERLVRTRKPLNESEVIDVLYQVLDALQEVHSQGLWHLDLKPANVMMDRNGTVKLIDFGASKQFNNKTGGALSTSAVTFTNGFAPLEQMERSYEKFGPWTDFYALGATLYNLLSNQRPPMPSDINDDLTPDKHMALPMPDSISTGLRELVLWLMKTNRMERPTSVADIMDYLNHHIAKVESSFQDDEETKVVSDDDEHTAADSDAPAASGASVAEGGGMIQSIRKNNSWLLYLAGAIIALVVVAGIKWSANKSTTLPSIENQTDKINMVTNKDVAISLGVCSYTGQVNDKGIPHGMGRAVFTNGDKCEGEFANGDLNGENVHYYFANGDTFVGKIVDNSLSQGRYTTSDGSYFEGKFVDNSPSEGVWYDKSGNKIS